MHITRRRRPETRLAEKFREARPLNEREIPNYLKLTAQLLPFAKAPAEVPVTESYVAVPPALFIDDAQGQRWTLGFMTAPRNKSPDGEYAFDVLRNGMYAGECASRIELRGGKVRIFTADGWKRWNGNTFI